LKLQVPDENVGDMLVELTNVTKGPEQRQCCCDEKAKKCNGRNSQRQGRLEIEVERHIGFYRRRSLPQPLIAQEFTFSALPAPSVQKKAAADGQFAQSFSGKCLFPFWMRRPIYGRGTVPINTEGNTPMSWTTPTLVEVCIGLEINGYLPPEF
jgi:coenzyme PQQ precursor peptide PqqA